jgi:anti-anti-sigma factor
MTDGQRFGCDVARFRRRVIIGVRGAIDGRGAPELERAVHAVLTPEVRGVVLDLNYCSEVDELGARAIARLREDLEQRGAVLQLTSIPQTVETRLRAFGLTRPAAAR